MKKFFFCTAALLAALSFTACSDDDETNLPVTSDNIVGTWQIVHEQTVEIFDDEKEAYSVNYPDEDGWYYTLTFDKDGSCINTSYEEEQAYSSQNYTYTISGSTLTLKSYEGTRVFEIKKFSESELVLYLYYKESTYSIESTETYKRIE